MRKRVLTLALALVICLGTLPVVGQAQAAGQASWTDTYTTYLEENRSLINGNAVAFADITGDGVREMIVFTGWKFEFFTCKNNSLLSLGYLRSEEASTSTDVLFVSDGSLWGITTGGSWQQDEVYSSVIWFTRFLPSNGVEATRAEQLKYSRFTNFGENTDYYYHNEAKITKAKYDELLNDVISRTSAVLFGEGFVSAWYEEYNFPVRDFSAMTYSEAIEYLNSQDPKVPSDWARDEVNAAISAGLVPEVLQKDYKGNVARIKVAHMFINLIEKSSGMSIDDFLTAKGVSMDNNAFTDTSDKAVLAANALGIINGVGNSKFDPGGIFTRAQIAVIINRTARVLGVVTEGYGHSFTDLAGHWADSELGWPVHAGIVNGVGDNKYDPDSYLTTEQVIIITYRAMASIKDLTAGND